MKRKEWKRMETSQRPEQNQYYIWKDERQQCHYKHLQTEGAQGLKELYQNNLYFRFKWCIIQYRHFSIQVPPTEWDWKTIFYTNTLHVVLFSVTEHWAVVAVAGFIVWLRKIYSVYFVSS